MKKRVFFLSISEEHFDMILKIFLGEIFFYYPPSYTVCLISFFQQVYISVFNFKKASLFLIGFPTSFHFLFVSFSLEFFFLGVDSDEKFLLIFYSPKLLSRKGNATRSNLISLGFKSQIYLENNMQFQSLPAILRSVILLPSISY